MAENDDTAKGGRRARSGGDSSPDRLEHSAGGRTTRDDPTDLGVPMLPGDPKERQGPEDALGAGPKRGDYSGRLGDANYHPHQVEAIPDAQPGEDAVRVVDQAPHAADQGEVPGKKGGVDTVDGA